VLLVVVCFLTGVAMRLKWGAWLGRTIEQKVLARIPGYTVFRSLSKRFSGETDGDVQFTPALLSTAPGASTLVFIVEEHPSGDLTVFTPMTSTPGMGTIQVTTRDQVKKLDASMSEALDPFWHFGIGTRELVAGSKATITQSPGAAPPEDR
jgi:uncharacterized membrane protein